MKYDKERMKSYIIFLICTSITFGLHHLHNEWMSILVDSGTLVGIAMLVLEKK